MNAVRVPRSRGRLSRSVPRAAACVVALGAALGVAGCAGNAAKENFYALTDGGVVVVSMNGPARAADVVASGSGSAAGIVVSAVTIPELVDRPQIVTRDATSRVIVSEQNLWAESVKAGVGRTLATRLARALADAGRPTQVAAYPQSSIADPVLRITVDIVRFDAVPNGEAVVDALWSIRRPSDGTVRSGHTTASAPIAGTRYEAIVEGWNAALAVVELDIATTVLAVDAEVPATLPPKR